MALGALALGWTVLAPLEFLGSDPSGAAPTVVSVPNTTNIGGIACWSSTNCVAVGTLVTQQLAGLGGITASEAVIVPITDGVPGPAQVLSGLSSSAGFGPVANLNHVACEPTTTTCFATGSVSSSGSTNPTQAVVVPITDGSAGTPQTFAGDLFEIACPSSSSCLAIGDSLPTTGPTVDNAVFPITNGVLGTPAAIPGASSTWEHIACLSATDCLAAGQAEVSVGGANQQEGAIAPIINGIPQNVVTDSAIVEFDGGACPTATSCLFSGVAATTDNQMVVSVDGNGNAGTGQLAIADPQLLIYSANIGCVSSTDCLLMTENGASPTGFELVPIINGIPGSPVGVTLAAGFSEGPGVMCPTSSSCLGFGAGADGDGAIVSLSAPSTTMLLPSNNATVNGSIWLDAGPSSLVGLASSTFEVSGGPNSLSDQVVSSSTPTLYGWIGAWDTFDVPNGTYTIQNVATDDLGLSTTSAPVTVTVDNPPLQSTTVIIPSDGGTLSGTGAVLDALTSGAAASVQFVVNGGSLSNDVVANGTPTIYGWLAKWDTTGVANGTYTLQSVATDATGATVTNPGITVTIAN